MDIAPRITIDEKVRFGKPVIKGTRVPVDLVIGKLAGGMTYEEVSSDIEKCTKKRHEKCTTRAIKNSLFS